MTGAARLSAGAELEGEPEMRALSALVDAIAASAPTELADGRPDEVRQLRSALVEAGLWTLGVAEPLGGGGASWRLTLWVIEQLGRRWPALAWSAAQSHAALAVLPGDQWAPVRAELHDGRPAAVVDAAHDHVQLRLRSGDGEQPLALTGVVRRIDAGGPDPLLVVLDGDDTWLVTGGADIRPAGDRTGLGGACSCAAVVDAPVIPPGRIVDVAAYQIDGAPTDAARVWLHAGGAAIAAGIAAAAAEAALAYAGQREQFGDALTALPTMRQALFGQAGAASGARAAAVSAEADPLAAAGALRSACEAALDVAAGALQCHGGYGYLDEYPVERHLRDALSLWSASGARDAARVAAARLAGRGGRGPRIAVRA